MSTTGEAVNEAAFADPAPNVRAEMRQLVAALQAIDIRSYEGLELDEQVARIHPVATSLLARGAALVEQLRALYEPSEGQPSERTLSFELAMDAAVEQRARAAVADVADIAFCAQLELQQRRQRLKEVARSRDPIALLGDCDSALRRLYKALCAIDIALARATLTEPSLDFTSELQRSLRVRRYYARFTGQILSGPEPTPGTLLARLRGAGTAIAVLVGHDVYSELRVRDRLQLRSLQRRILDWLAPAPRADATDTGFQLWSDVKAFVGMLRGVNSRQELLEHDAKVMRDALAFAACGGREFPLELRQPLEALAGLDPGVDRLLKSEAPFQVGGWLPILEALGHGLGGQNRVP
ncbi:MAG TPA: hypothetical protein VFK05_33010 [Polyangiaceae bacterium]|nr:hypothetical protein [Polyangiaceae bacterium]